MWKNAELSLQDMSKLSYILKKRIIIKKKERVEDRAKPCGTPFVMGKGEVNPAALVELQNCRIRCFSYY